jgi:hypothetical protein
MSLTQFDNGYWYVNELKSFAEDIGIPSPSKLRKDQLEKSIKHFLRNGKVRSSLKAKPQKVDFKDTVEGLRKRQFIRNNTNNNYTNGFII